MLKNCGNVRSGAHVRLCMFWLLQAHASSNWQNRVVRAGSRRVSVRSRQTKSPLGALRAKHRSLDGHARLSRRVAGLIPFYEFGEERFSVPTMPRRQSPTSAAPVSGGWRSCTGNDSPKRALTVEAAESISDLQFTDAYRAPFQYRRIVQGNLRAGSFLAASDGVTLTNLDVTVSTTWLARMG